MQNTKANKYDLTKLLKWLDDDPYKSAKLISEVPVSSLTLERIKAGSYKPSTRLANGIMAVIERNS